MKHVERRPLSESARRYGCEENQQSDDTRGTPSDDTCPHEASRDHSLSGADFYHDSVAAKYIAAQKNRRRAQVNSARDFSRIARRPREEL